MELRERIKKSESFLRPDSVVLLAHYFYDLVLIA